MSNETLEKLDAALAHVPSSRRDLLKRLLVGAGAVLLAPVSQVLAGGNAVEDCINNRLYNFYKGQFPGVMVTVNGSAVVLTGTIGSGPRPGVNAKAALTKMAKYCGATKVTNKIVVLPQK